MPTPQPKSPGDLIDQARQAAIAAGIDPDVFARQIQQESGFDPNARSGAGALGIAQFMPDTAKGLGINPLDPKAALPAAAGLMKSYLDRYQGDYRKALAAYNAGPGAVDKAGGVPDFAETQAYVNKIYGDGKPTAQTTPQAVHTAGGGTEVSQFELGLSTSDAYAFCGPAAAMAFASMYGRNPTAQEAKALAQKVGWTPEQGMAGVQSEQKLLESMDIATRLEDKINWDHVANDASNGNPVIIDTPGHYYYVDGYDAKTGKYHVGKSGTALKGGSEWMSASEINGMPQSGGDARSALYADHPLSSTPSMYVAGRSAPNDVAVGWGSLPTTFTLGMGGGTIGAGADGDSSDDQDTPWWERAGKAVLNAPGAIAGGVASVASGAVQGAADVVQGAAQSLANQPDPDQQASTSSLPHKPDTARTLADVAASGQPTLAPDQEPTPIPPSLDKSQGLLDQGKTVLPHAGDTAPPPRRSLDTSATSSALTPPGTAPLQGQFALPAPPPETPPTAIERVMHGDTGRAQASPDTSAPSDDPVTQAARSIIHPGAQASLGQTVSNVVHDPVVDISDDGYRGQLRKAAEKAIINVDGGPLQMLFDPTIAAFGTQAPVEVAINAMFGMDPLTGVAANKAIGLAGRSLGRMVAPIAPARAVAQGAQKVLSLTGKPGEAAFGAAQKGVNALLTRGLDQTTLGATGRALADHFGADEQADVLEAAGAYLKDRSLDAEALRLRRMTTLIKPVTGRELETQVRVLAQKAGQPQLADEILRNAGYSELTSPYTNAVRNLASRPARSVPEIARGATNMLVGGTLGAAMTGIYANDKNDPSYDSKLSIGTFIGASAMIGMPYAQVLSKTITPKVLETAQELFGNMANLHAPTQAVLRDYLQSKAVIEFRQKLMADDIRTAFGPKDEWSKVFQHLEETGDLPPELAGDPIAKQVWQEILDSNARTAGRGDVGDAMMVQPKTPGFDSPQAYIHHAVDDEWAAAKRGAERYDPTPPNRGPRSNPISQYNKSREWATTREGEAQPSPVKYNYSLDEILPNQWAAQQMQALNEVLEGNLRGMAVDPTTMTAEEALNHDVLSIPEGATGYFKPKGYDQGNSIISDLHISRQLRSSLNRIYGDRGGISGIPGFGKVYDATTRFFGGMKLGMIAGSAFHAVNEWHQFGAAMGGLDVAETHIPEMLQMSMSKGAWRAFVDANRDDLAKFVRDGGKFDPFTEPVTNQTQRVIQAGLLGGGGYVGGFQAAKRAGKSDQEAAAWGAIGAGMGAGMALPFFGQSGGMVDLFTDSLFKRTIPMMKYQVYLAHGATPEAASFANEAFGEINTDAILRSRWFTDTARLAGFAPQWTEGFWRQTGRALWDTGTTGQTARKFWASAAMNGMYMLQGLNLALSGHWSWQNEPGHETEVETTGLMDRNGYSRVPNNSLSGVPQRTYLDILPAWRSLITPPLETSKWLLAAAASTPQGQQLGLDNPHITGRSNGVQVAPAPDPAKAWGSYLTNRSGLIPNTLNNLFSDTDFRGQPLNLPTDSLMDQTMRRMGSALQSLAPMSPAQGITQAVQGEPLPIVALSAATGMRTSAVNPGAVRAQTETQLRQQTTGKTPTQQRDAETTRLQYNQQQDLSALQATQKPDQTAADRLKIQRDYPHLNLTNYEKAQVPPEVMMQHPDTVVGMLAQIDAINKAAATSATSDPADLPAVLDTDPDTLFQQAWNQDPSKLQGLTADQQWQVRQQWTVQTARNAGLDEKVVEDVVKSHLYGMDMPAVPGVSSLELDTLADEWKQTGDSADPVSQHAQRQTMLNDYAQQKGVDPNALSERVRLRILLAGDQTGQQQSYSRALTVLEAAHNPATAPEYVNADGTAMGTPDDWVQWDKKLSSNNDKYDKAHGRYLDTNLQILSDAKTRGAVKPADTVYRSKGYWDYQRWFGVGRNMTDAQFSQYRAGTLDMWSDHPDAKEAQNRADILELYKTLTPDQRTKAMVQIQWHGKPYTLNAKYAIHTLGLVKNNKWQDEGLDPGIDPGAPGVDTGFQ